MAVRSQSARSNPAPGLRYNFMPHLHTAAGALHLLQLFVALFLAILFLQSGVDKILDRAGNLGWLKGHFAKSPLASFVPLLLSTITLMERAAGALSGIGAVLIVLRRGSAVAFYGAVLAALAIIALF